MISDSERWMHTDTLKEAYKSLEKLDETLSLLPTDVYQWKWALIILHNCAQAFMVLALEGTSQIDVVKNRKEYADCLYKLSQGKEMDEDMKKTLSIPQLDYFLKLYCKIKDTNNTQLFWSNTKFHSTKEHDDAMNLLNEYRNQFIHFLPCSWGIKLSDLPLICVAVMGFVQYMINDLGNFMYRFNDEEQGQIQNLVISINDKLKVINNEL